MSQAIGELLPMAVGVAVSPVPIIAVILMLFTGRARANSLAFLIGWIVGIAAALAVLVGAASTQDLSSGGQSSDTASWIKLALGLAVLLLAARAWRSRPAPGEDARLPSWMSRIDSMGPVAAFGLAVALSAVNPKNLVLIAGGAVAIVQANLPGGDQAIAIALFTAIGAVTVAIPTLGFLFLGPRIQPSLDRAKAWLLAHDAAVMAVLLLVIGATLIGKGLGALS